MSETHKVVTVLIVLVFVLVWPELTYQLPLKCCCGDFL